MFCFKTCLELGAYHTKIRNILLNFQNSYLFQMLCVFQLDHFLRCNIIIFCYIVCTIFTVRDVLEVFWKFSFPVCYKSPPPTEHFDSCNYDQRKNYFSITIRNVNPTLLQSLYSLLKDNLKKESLKSNCSNYLSHKNLL